MTTSADSTHDDSLPALLQAEAQADAERFYGEGPPPAWEPGEEDRDDAEPAPLWRRAAWGWLPAGALAVVAAWVVHPGWAHGDVDAPPRPAAPRVDAYTASAGTGDPDEDIIDDAAPAAAAPAPVTRHAAAAPHAPLDITRRGNEWRIDAHGASRLLAAQRLAEATGSKLLGNVDLLSTTRPLDLQWTGRQATLAWEAVLGSELSFATQCSSRRCRVWILDAGAANAAVIAPQVRPAIPLPAAAAPDVTAAVTRATDSPDPRTAAHHD